jgi:hypothetical protein
MNFSKSIYDNIKELTMEQNIVFVLSCLNRLKHLLKLFTNSDTYGINYLDKIIPKETIEDMLNDIIKKLYNKPLDINKNEINNDIKILEKMLLDDDIESCTVKQIFFYYIVIMIHTFEFILTKEHKYIELCSDAMMEIINQTKGNEFNKNNPQWTDEEFYKNVDMEIDKELEKEIEIIKIIRTGDKKILDEYIENNKLEYNV